MTHEMSGGVCLTDGAGHRAARVIDVVSRVVGVEPPALLAPSHKRASYARRLAAYALSLDAGSCEDVGEVFGVSGSVINGWCSWTRREMTHNRGAQRDLKAIAWALRTWAAHDHLGRDAGPSREEGRVATRAAGGAGEAAEGG